MQYKNTTIKEVRNSTGLTQKEFGVRIAVAQTYLSQIEKGERTVTEKIFKLICSEYGVNEKWLRTGEGEMFVHSDNTLLNQVQKEYKLSDMSRGILETYLHLDPFRQKVLNDIIVDMAAAVSRSQEEPKTPISSAEYPAYRIARSDDDAPPRIEKLTDEEIAALKSAPPIDSDDDL